MDNYKLTNKIEIQRGAISWLIEQDDIKQKNNKFNNRNNNKTIIIKSKIATNNNCKIKNVMV